MKLFEVGAKIFQPQHILVYGDPSTGKSTIVSQLAENKHGAWNLKWLSLDNGHVILQKLSPEAQARVELYNVPDVKDYPVGVDTLKILLERKNLHICDQHGKQDCSVCKNLNKSFSDLDLTKMTNRDIIVIDNISQLSDSVLSLICKGKPVDYKLQLDDWGSLRFHLMKYLTDIQQFPFHIICIAHAVEEKMTDGTAKIMPAVGSSTFAPKVTGYFDHAVYCNITSGSHKFGSKSTYRPSILTKSRTDVAIENMKEPSLADFLNGKLMSPAESATVSNLTSAASAASKLANIGGDKK